MSRQNNTSERNGLLWKTVRYIVRPLRIKSYSCSRLHAVVRKKRRRYQSSTPLQYGKYKNIRYFSFSLFSDMNLTGTTSFTNKNVHRFPANVFLQTKMYIVFHRHDENAVSPTFVQFYSLEMRRNMVEKPMFQRILWFGIKTRRLGPFWNKHRMSGCAVACQMRNRCAWLLRVLYS